MNGSTIPRASSESRRDAVVAVAVQMTVAALMIVLLVVARASMDEAAKDGAQLAPYFSRLLTALIVLFALVVWLGLFKLCATSTPDAAEDRQRTQAADAPLTRGDRRPAHDDDCDPPVTDRAKLYWNVAIVAAHALFWTAFVIVVAVPIPWWYVAATAPVAVAVPFVADAAKSAAGKRRALAVGILVLACYVATLTTTASNLGWTPE